MVFLYKKRSTENGHFACRFLDYRKYGTFPLPRPAVHPRLLRGFQRRSCDGRLVTDGGEVPQGAAAGQGPTTK